MKHVLLAFTLLLTLKAQAVSLSLNDVFRELPTLDDTLPAPKEISGVDVGERHWYHYEIVNYLNALAEASPRMIALGEHARTYGGRPLVSYAISTPENLARLDEIKAARAAIIDPEAEVDLSAQPAVLHMMYSIHGNEPSGANSTPLVAYYLNAAQDNELLKQLENVIIIFNPMLNPDGLDRFAYWSNAHRGVNPSFDANDREHAQSVPNGRTNYYWFDLNRDWLPTQLAWWWMSAVTGQSSLAWIAQPSGHSGGERSAYWLMASSSETSFENLVSFGSITNTGLDSVT
jgi:hypothetical protein